MRKPRLRLAGGVWLATVIGATGAALLFSTCSSDNAGPTLTTQGEGRQDGEIYGYVRDAETSDPIYNALVVWYVEDESGPMLGYDRTDSSGRYDIQAEAWWSSHVSETFKGIAAKTGYQDDVEWIVDFQWENVPYHVDFDLVSE
jgi:hypothetical protein